MISRSRYTAFLDANVLYSAAIRDICMEVALAKMYRAKWSADVQREWLKAVLRNRPDLELVNLERTRDLMVNAIPSAMVTGYENLIECIPLEKDPDDRHVVAAAIVGQCDVIVTNDLGDFPKDVLKNFGLEAQRPDDFLAHHLDLEPGTFCSAVRTARVGKKNPPYTVEQYLLNLTKYSLVVTVAGLRQYAHLLA
ncbi:MAG: PIN domain-containing protein [Chloroflexota bacterium]|nr:PIN domain-containing protein [Chloroflexota bacterium]MDE2949656.1 PIN domain-containing protein [Chloroflexota bacterium]